MLPLVHFMDLIKNSRYFHVNYAALIFSLLHKKAARPNVPIPLIHGHQKSQRKEPQAYYVYTDTSSSLITCTTQIKYTHIKHVIQERYPCATISDTSAIEVDLHLHICLLGHPLNLSNPRRS